jgi:hypothetical protein
MRVFTTIISVLLLTGCTKSVDVPKDKYGISTRFGEIQKSISGPGTIKHTIFIGNVTLINKKDKFMLHDKKFIVHYSVDNPEEYFKRIGWRGNPFIIELIEKELAKHALVGKVVNTKELLYEMIEGMNLPIVLE